MIQAVYKDVEMEMELHQPDPRILKVRYTAIKHPERIVTLRHGNESSSRPWRLPRSPPCAMLAPRSTGGI